MPERKPVGDNELLYRRGYSNPIQRYMNPDGSATSRVFKLRENDKEELSVNVKSLTTAAASVCNPHKFFLFEISNKSIIEIEDLRTLHDRLLDGSNDAHAVIIGMTLSDDIKPGLLARKSKRVYF